MKFPVSVAWHSGEGKVQHRVRSHYVVGCDGARSWTRSQIGVEMNGNNTGITIADLPIDCILTSHRRALGCGGHYSAN